MPVCSSYGNGASRRVRPGQWNSINPTETPAWIPIGCLNLRELKRGAADTVAGRIDIDPAEAAMIPARLHEDDARECIYADLLDRINAEFDLDPFDPWPRHEHSGASIAVTLSAYRRAGGRRGMIKPDETIDDRLEAAEDAARRAHLRNQVQILWRSRREECVLDLATNYNCTQLTLREHYRSHTSVVYSQNWC
jgi:hypothetical protein